MVGLISRAMAVWLVMAVAAIVNGLLRESLLLPLLGSTWALPVSGIILSLLILVIAYLLLPWIAVRSESGCLLLGLFWLLLTLCLEVPFGYFVLEKSWHEIMQVFILGTGNLFSVVLLITAVSPWIAARIRGCCQR